MQKNLLPIFFLLFLVILATVGFRFSAFAEEALPNFDGQNLGGQATSTLPSEEQIIATTTPTISESSLDTPSSLPISEETVPPPPSPPVSSPLPPAPEPQPTPPPPPPVEPVVPLVSTDGHAFDAATAPSRVKLKVLNPDGSVPTIPVFITFVGVGGRTYGGPLDREGAIETIMPTGRYYADVLVLDTKFGPPSDPPSFFLEANEERDFGALTLTDKSSFADEALEREFATALEGKSGFAKIFSLIVKLLLAILKELRGLRSELLGR